MSEYGHVEHVECCVSDLMESHPEKLSNGRIRPRESDRAGFVWMDLLKTGIIGWNIYGINPVRLTTLRSGWLRLRDRQNGQERAYHNNGRRRPPPTAHLTSPTLV
jgi:hypothetical protein